MNAAQLHAAAVLALVIVAAVLALVGIYGGYA